MKWGNLSPRLRADGFLFLAALIWGTGFVAQKNANDYLGPILFVGLRFLLSAVVLFPFVFYEAKRQVTPMKKRDVGLAVLLGLFVFAGSTLQQTGLVTTTITNGGFLTAVYVVLVPFVVWLLTKKSPRIAVLFGCLLSIVGAWLLATNGHMNGGAHIGDILLLLADFAWATVITLVPVFLERTHRPFFLCFAQFAVTAVIGTIAGLIFQPTTYAQVAHAIPALLYVGILSGGLAFTLQMIAQRHIPAAEAALIMSFRECLCSGGGRYRIWRAADRSRHDWLRAHFGGSSHRRNRASHATENEIGVGLMLHADGL